MIWKSDFRMFFNEFINIKISVVSFVSRMIANMKHQGKSKLVGKFNLRYKSRFLFLYTIFVHMIIVKPTLTYPYYLPLFCKLSVLIFIKNFSTRNKFLSLTSQFLLIMM